MSNPIQGIARTLVIVALAALPALGTARPAAAATIIYVNAAATGANNGTSWANAYKNLKTAIAAASAGKEIWVAKGTYKPGNQRTDSFSLKNGVAIYGGFVGTETKRSQRNPKVNVTKLSGDIGAAGTNTDNSYHVVTSDAVDATAVLDGFLITAANADGVSPDDIGGGVFNDNSSTPTFANLTIKANQAVHGGGMYNLSSSPHLTKVVFLDNKASSEGGGMKTYDGDPILHNVVFRNNEAGAGGGLLILNGVGHLNDVTFDSNKCPTGSGGGMDLYASNAILTNVTFTGNSAFDGAGMISNGSSPVLTNVTFQGNHAAGFGGGMWNIGAGTPNLKHVTFGGNIADTAGGAIYSSNVSPTIANSILYGDTGGEIANAGTASPTVTYSDVQGGYAGSGNVDDDPQLGTLKKNGGVTKTMVPVNAMAVADLADSGACAEKDQRGVDRPQGFGCDMGAVEVRAISVGSQGKQDGWVLESSETSGKGGSLDRSATTLLLGDDGSNRQYRAVLSFNTAAIPDRASILLGKLKVVPQSSAGAPFANLGLLTMDVRNPYFGSLPAVQKSDFQAGASALDAGSISDTLIDGTYYLGYLNAPAGLAAINKKGSTQLRLRFQTDDNGDNFADTLSLYSGDATPLTKPQLFIYYSP